MFFKRQVLVKAVEGAKTLPSGTLTSSTQPTQSQRVTAGGAGGTDVGGAGGVSEGTMGVLVGVGIVWGGTFVVTAIGIWVVSACKV